MAVPSTHDAVRRTCMNAAWVKAQAATSKVDPSARDPATNRKVHPWLRPSLRSARFKVQDLRMTPNVYTATCGFQETVYGMGATVDASTGSIVNQGTVQGTFVAEWGGWPTHEVTSYVNAILLQEVLGYDVSFVYSSGTYSTERMSTMGRGVCTPTHLNPEVWTTSQMTTLKQHANESTMSNIGYWGRSGHYTLRANVQDALLGPLSVSGNLTRPISADFWREFTLTNELIEFFSVHQHNRSRICQVKILRRRRGGLLGRMLEIARVYAERSPRQAVYVSAQYAVGVRPWLPPSDHVQQQRASVLLLCGGLGPPSVRGRNHAKSRRHHVLPLRTRYVSH
ncbi:hypothetical protein H257_16940 [Aphanomyces astaci]|uniref:Uncharacterized protein n=1 Tax=Aphanomyces astaci TaxID=112090 RepID=W4FIH5_APHAT|nr:hypothetical protein H257_16940 [Aphanomyces astaci]ETV66634.1 hypothetical protein H257_16940 [Aphanomyces astaci]|eukprot:XP_009843862.1 hypothetical protein H257_16940 [Aphanomyces astaci]